MFMNTTLQAAVHFGRKFTENHIRDSLGQLIEEKKRRICELSEVFCPKTPDIVGLKIIEYEDTTWRSISLLRERVYQVTIAKVYVFSDSVLCMGEMGGDPNAAWMNKIKWYLENNHFKELNRIDGIQTEFEWKIPPGFTTIGILEEIQKFMKSIQCEPEHFTDRIIFMSMLVIRILLKLGSMRADSIAVIALSQDLDWKRLGTRLVLTNQTKSGTKLQHR